jgi:AcrR family transcriptional regulator
MERIVAAAREALEADGPEGLTMQAVADATGVRAPSLYKRVRSRRDLIRLVATDAIVALTRDLDAAATTGDARRDLAAVATAYRAFAHERPEAYRLLFSGAPGEEPIDPELNERSSAALIRITSELAGPERALPAARLAVAWAHGFVSMELAGAFRLGGDVDAAFDYGVERIVAAIAGSAPAG